FRGARGHPRTPAPPRPRPRTTKRATEGALRRHSCCSRSRTAGGSVFFRQFFLRRGELFSRPGRHEFGDVFYFFFRQRATEGRHAAATVGDLFFDQGVTRFEFVQVRTDGAGRARGRQGVAAGAGRVEGAFAGGQRRAAFFATFAFLARAVFAFFFAGG